MTTDADPLEPPDNNGEHLGRVVARAAVAAVPFLGGAALELYDGALREPLARRTAEWMQTVADKLREHEVRFTELGERADFITAMVQCARSAQGTHNEDKLTALRNAVVNVALNPDLADEETAYFLSLVDQLAPSEMRLLVYLSDPPAWVGRRGIHFPSWGMGGIATAIEFALPEFSGRRETYDLYGRDLYSRGLISTANFHTTVTGPSITESIGTHLGLRFVDFVSEAA